MANLLNNDERRRYINMLVVCAILQLAVYGAALVVAANNFGPPNPWPTITLFGVVLGQCCLNAAFTVFGPLSFPIRLLLGALIVIIGGLLVITAIEPPPRFYDVVLFSLFALLMWAIIQVPLWLCRILLRAKLVIGTITHDGSKHQYGIRQLMGVTLAVAVVLGLGRAVIPAEAVRDLANVRLADWILFVSLAISAGLIVSTTVLTTLNTYYWRLGLGVSAVSSALVAYGLYSVIASLSTGAARESMWFAIMMLFTYAWLQISVLLIRAAGYRIVVRT